MSFLRRMFSPSYRRAVEAEAGGDYAEAARRYALAGLRAKVAEMHLCDAQQKDSLDARWRSLRAAAHFVDRDVEEERALLRRIGAEYLVLLRRGVHTDWDRMLCREAAQILQRGGDPTAAGEAYELAGDDPAAADAFRDAGDLERMEAVHTREERRSSGQREERDHAAQAELHWALGQRDVAVQELRAALSAAEAGGGEAAARDRLRQRLQERSDALLTVGRLALRWTARGGAVESRIYIGVFPLWIGRGAECPLRLRDVGVSRAHASLAVTGAPTPQFALRDLGSRNGTTLNQVPIAAELPLRGEGELGIGEHATLAYQIEGTVLRLSVRRGMDRGLVVLASPQSQELWGGAVLRFADGRPLLSAAELVLNDRRAAASVQLVRGDVVDLPAGRLEVLP